MQGDTNEYPRAGRHIGIYEIYCTANDKRYIGSAEHLRQRRTNHLSLLRRNIHPNIHLQRCWNLYGETTLEWSVLEFCEIDQLLIREQFYIDTLKPELNIALAAGAPMKGRHHSEEYVNRMRTERRGIPRTPEHKRKIAESKIGKPLSDEHKAAISNALKNSKYHGENVASSKLTDADVIKIRRLHATGEYTQAQLGEMFGVYHTAIGRIIHRKTWQHIA